MPSHRSLRVAEAIREVVASAILFDVSDPRVRSVTVLRVEVTGDLRFATIFVSIMGNESERRRSLRGLDHATGFLQARVAARLQTRFTPVLSFKQDDSVKKSAEISRLIDDAVASDLRRADESARAVDGLEGFQDRTPDLEANADAARREPRPPGITKGHLMPAQDEKVAADSEGGQSVQVGEPQNS